MEIKVLGPGCHKCHELDKRTREVAKELGIDADVEYIQDINKLIEYSILFPPGLVINGNLVSCGKVLGKNEIRQFITDALAD
jgi:small redox-active disulfide protein 2